MSVYRLLRPDEKGCGYLVAHTREDGVVEIPLTDSERLNELLERCASGNGRFRVERFARDGTPEPMRGDAWEPVTPQEIVQALVRR
jgi:hypothetical protein